MTTLRQQLIHLKKDKVLRKVITSTKVVRGKKETDLYVSLMRAVVGQQLSVKAAQTIWSRFLALFSEKYPFPKQILEMPEERLREVGLSYQKASYVKNIARFSLDNTLDYDLLKRKENDELIEHLVTIKGVGRWTVEMILMFNLQREDVFPMDDLGIQNAIKLLYGIESTDKRKMFAMMEKISENWRPYRTLACLYLWKFKDQVR